MEAEYVIVFWFCSKILIYLIRRFDLKLVYGLLSLSLIQTIEQYLCESNFPALNLKEDYRHSLFRQKTKGHFQLFTDRHRNTLSACLQRSQNCEKRLLASVYLSVFPHETTRLQLDGASLNFTFWTIF